MKVFCPVLCGERVSDFTAYVCVKRDGKGAKEDEEGFIKCYSVLLQYSHYLLSQEQMRGNSLQSPTKSVLAKSNPNRVRSPPRFLLATFRQMRLEPAPKSPLMHAGFFGGEVQPVHSKTSASWQTHNKHLSFVTTREKPKTDILRLK